jgi:hypothetical protein
MFWRRPIGILKPFSIVLPGKPQAGLYGPAFVYTLCTDINKTVLLFNIKEG